MTAEELARFETSRLTYNLSVDQVIPVWSDKEVHAGVNYNHGSLYDWNSYSPSEPRWVGVSGSTKL